MLVKIVKATDGSRKQTARRKIAYVQKRVSVDYSRLKTEKDWEAFSYFMDTLWDFYSGSLNPAVAEADLRKVYANVEKTKAIFGILSNILEVIKVSGETFLDFVEHSHPVKADKYTPSIVLPNTNANALVNALGDRFGTVGGAVFLSFDLGSNIPGISLLDIGSRVLSDTHLIEDHADYIQKEVLQRIMNAARKLSSIKVSSDRVFLLNAQSGRTYSVKDLDKTVAVVDGIVNKGRVYGVKDLSHAHEVIFNTMLKPELDRLDSNHTIHDMSGFKGKNIVCIGQPSGNVKFAKIKAILLGLGCRLLPKFTKETHLALFDTRNIDSKKLAVLRRTGLDLMTYQDLMTVLVAG